MCIEAAIPNDEWIYWVGSDRNWVCRGCCHKCNEYARTQKAYYSNWVGWVWNFTESDSMQTLAYSTPTRLLCRWVYVASNYISLCWCDKLTLLLLAEVTFFCCFRNFVKLHSTPDNKFRWVIESTDPVSMAQKKCVFFLLLLSIFTSHRTALFPPLHHSAVHSSLLNWINFKSGK